MTRIFAFPVLTVLLVASCANRPEVTLKAICSGSKSEVDWYLSHRGDPNATIATDTLHGDEEDSLLSIAIGAERFDIARLLLSKGADPNGARKESEFPLWWAARSGNLEMIKDLVSRGADLNTQRPGNGTTALHVAIYFNHPEVLRYLVEKGASARKKTLDRNPWGIYNATPQELAAELGRKDLEALLRQK